MKTINGCGIKRVALINDLSCIGKCSLSVAMPIISSYGVETALLPTAVLSTHTAGFEGFVLHDMTEQMKLFADHWKKIGVKFDCIYTGFLCSVEQIRFVCEFIKEFAEKDTTVIVDPVLGDNGSLYSCFSEDFVREMQKLTELADLITPNRTEAALLSKSSIDTSDDQLLSALSGRNVVITSVERENKIGYVASLNSKTVLVEKEKLPIKLHGAGDVFTSAMCGEILNGADYEDALRNAADFCDKCIRDTVEKQPAHWYGVWFEDELKRRSPLFSNP